MNTYTKANVKTQEDQFLFPTWSPLPSVLPNRFTARSVPNEIGLQYAEELIEIFPLDVVELEVFTQ